MFGKRKFLIAFLNNSELRLVSYLVSGGVVSRDEIEVLDINPLAVKDSTIVDAQLFQSEVAGLFSGKKKFGNLPVLLVLPEEKVFIKGFELDLGDLERKNFFRDEFLSEVPFEESELIIHERLVGRVLEFSALHRNFIEDFRQPFLNQRMSILGVTSIPQMMAMELQPKERSFILAFYDNDFVLALAENSSIIFSETHPMKADDVTEAMKSFDHFVQHLKAADIKSVSIILGEDSIEEALKNELERREYVIREIKNMNVLDMIAGYYDVHKDEAGKWDLVRVKTSPLTDAWNRYGRTAAVSFSIILALIALGGAAWWGYGKFYKSPAAAEPAPIEQPVESETPVVEETPIVIPAEKSDFPIQIFNGTKLAGEAGRLKTVLTDRGFTVSSAGNNDDQNQVVTTIFVKSDAPDEIINELRLILEGRYQEILVSPSPVPENNIRIVIGKKKPL